MPKTTVFVCHGHSCKRKSTSPETLQKTLEETFKEKDVLIEKRGCQGNCMSGPTLKINWGEYGNMTTEKAVEIVQKELDT